MKENILHTTQELHNEIIGIPLSTSSFVISDAALQHLVRKGERFFKHFTQQVCVCAAHTNLRCTKSSAEMR